MKRSAAAPADENEFGFFDDDKPAPRAMLAVDVARLETPPIRSYSTGIVQLDHLLGGGINTRELLVVLGPPGGCKTAFAVSTAVAMQRRMFGLYVSTELELHELMARVAANVLGKPWSGIRRGTIDRSTLVEALDGIQIRLLGCDVLPRDGDDAIAMIEREALALVDAYQQPPLVIVDYLQDLARGSERETRAKVGDQASALRSMSQRLDCPIVAVSSVGRAYYNPKRAAELREADDPTVYLAAAKESGDVDYAAARVLFLDAEDDRDKPERAVRIAVAKSRDGRVGFAGARVVSESGRFLAAPEAVGEMSTLGRAERKASDKTSEDEAALFRVIAKFHADGKRDLATYAALKGKGIGNDKVRPTLERLQHAGRIRSVIIERIEAGPKGRAKTFTREVFEPVGPSRAEGSDG